MTTKIAVLPSVPPALLHSSIPGCGAVESTITHWGNYPDRKIPQTLQFWNAGKTFPPTVWGRCSEESEIKPSAEPQPSPQPATTLPNLLFGLFLC